MKRKISFLCAALCIALTGCSDSPYQQTLREMEKAFDRKNSAEIVSIAEGYLKDNPDSTAVPETAADYCMKLGDGGSAREFYYRACKNKPTAARAKKYLQAMAETGGLDGLFEFPPREEIMMGGMPVDEYIQANKKPKTGFSHELSPVVYSVYVRDSTDPAELADMFLPFGMTYENTGLELLQAGGLTPEQADILSCCTSVTLSRPGTAITIETESDSEKAVKPSYAPMWKLTLRSGDIELILTYDGSIGGSLSGYSMYAYYQAD